MGKAMISKNVQPYNTSRIQIYNSLPNHRKMKGDFMEGSSRAERRKMAAIERKKK